MLKQSPRTALEPVMACWVSCSGLRNVRARTRSAQRRLIPAKQEWELERKLITFRFRCQLCGRTDCTRVFTRSHGGTDKEHICAEICPLSLTIPQSSGRLILKGRPNLPFYFSKQLSPEWISVVFRIRY